MNDTFEDRLWSVLVDEVRSPSLPSFDDTIAVGAPAPKRGRTPMLVAGGIAVALALVAGVLVLGAGDDEGGSVVTASEGPATTAALDVPFLTFADPVGGDVHRVTMWKDPQERHQFRRVGSLPGATDIELSTSTGFATDDGFSIVATVNGIDIKTLDPENSGGVPMNLYHFSTPDGTSWIGGWGSDSDALPEISALIGAATFSADGISVTAPFREFSTPFGRPPAWAVQDGQAAARGFLDSTSDMADLPGEPVVVRGHEGRDEDGMLTWRETPDLVVSVTTSLQSMNSTGSGPISLEERVAAAERLVPGSKVGYEALPVWRGPGDSGVVVLQAPGREVSMVDYLALGADGKHFGSGSSSLGDVGSELEFVPGALELWIWNGDQEPGAPAGMEAIRTEAPACAQHIVVPAEGQAPVEVTIDPDCRD